MGDGVQVFFFLSCAVTDSILGALEKLEPLGHMGTVLLFSQLRKLRTV